MAGEFRNHWERRLDQLDHLLITTNTTTPTRSIMSHFTPNPALDLVLERTIAVSPERVWAAWTEPELLMQWFTPAPWKTVAAELDRAPRRPLRHHDGITRRRPVPERWLLSPGGAQQSPSRVDRQETARYLKQRCTMPILQHQGNLTRRRVMEDSAAEGTTARRRTTYVSRG